jgi:hypothetical protein
MKLDRRQLRRIINEEASMLGISLNEIMGTGGFSEPVSISFDPDFDRRIPAAVQDGRTGRFVVNGAIYTDSGKPVVMSPRNNVKLVLNVYAFPKSQPLYDEDTGEVVKDSKVMTFKFIDAATGAFMNSKEAARALTGQDDNFNSILRQVQEIWAAWIDGQDDRYSWLDMQSRIDITNIPSGASASAGTRSRPLTREEMVAQALGRAPASASGPSTARGAAATPGAAPGTAGTMMRQKIQNLIAAADMMKDLLDSSDEDAIMAIEEYLAASEAFRTRG